MKPDTDIEGEVGPLDDTALEQVRDEFTTLDGLVADAGFDSLLDPTKLVVRLDDGIGDADWCRFDVRWYRLGYYNFHYLTSRKWTSDSTSIRNQTPRASIFTNHLTPRQRTLPAPALAPSSRGW